MEPGNHGSSDVNILFCQLQCILYLQARHDILFDQQSVLFDFEPSLKNLIWSGLRNDFIPDTRLLWRALSSRSCCWSCFTFFWSAVTFFCRPACSQQLWLSAAADCVTLAEPDSAWNVLSSEADAELATVGAIRRCFLQYPWSNWSEFFVVQEVADWHRLRFSVTCWCWFSVSNIVGTASHRSSFFPSARCSSNWHSSKCACSQNRDTVYEVSAY